MNYVAGYWQMAVMLCSGKIHWYITRIYKMLTVGCISIPLTTTSLWLKHYRKGAIELGLKLYVVKFYICGEFLRCVKWLKLGLEQTHQNGL